MSARVYTGTGDPTVTIVMRLATTRDRLRSNQSASGDVTLAALFVGDMNVREKETLSITHLATNTEAHDTAATLTGLAAKPSKRTPLPECGLRDCWQEAGALQSQKLTWDSRTGRNMYHGRDDPASGVREFRFTARFDRVFVAEGRPYQSMRLVPFDFSLFANTPLSNQEASHFLSDHYGISCSFRLDESESNFSFEK